MVNKVEYIAPFCTKVHTKRSGMDHTVLPANNTIEFGVKDANTNRPLRCLRGQKYRTEIHKKHTISSENLTFFWEGGLAPPRPLSPWEGYPLPAHIPRLNQAFLIYSCATQNYSQIYTYGPVSRGPGITSFPFHFLLFSDVLLWVSCKTLW